MTRSLWSLILLSSLAMISAGCGSSGAATPGPTPTPTPTPTPGTVAISFSDPKPVAFAQKIGTGNWTTTSLPSNGTLVLQLPSGTTQYGVAFVCTSTRLVGQVKQEQIMEADSRDGSSYSLQLCLPDAPSPPPTGSLSGSFDATAIAGTSEVDISIDNFGTGAASVTPTGSFNITTALVGVTDLYAVAFNSSHTLLAMKIVRSQTVPGVANGGNTITLAASDVITTSMPIAIPGTPAGFNAPVIIHFPSYVTPNGSYAIGMGPDPFRPTGYSVAPATQVQPGDYYLVHLIVGSASPANRSVSTTQYLRTAAAVSLALPSPWAVTPPTPAPLPTFTFDYTGLADQPAVADNASISWSQGSASFGINVVATANHQNGVTALTMPDLTALPGFFSLAPPGTTISWGASTWGGTAQFYVGTTVIPQTISRATGFGSYTQP